MIRSFGGIGRILVQTGPALLAWYFAGSLVRAIVIAFAAPIGPQSALAALLLVPIAVLARLVSYIGMFMVVRRAMRTYRQLAQGDVAESSLRETVSEFSTVLLASILPFFALYGLMGLIAEDLSDYARSAFRYSLGGGGVLAVGSGPLVLVVIVVAFGGRMLLKSFGSRLPRWLAIVEIYLEATWIFVAVNAVGTVFGSLSQWIADRQVVQWVVEGREFLRDLWTPFKLVIDGIDWLTPVAVQLVLLPLAWLLLAGVIYTRALATAVHERIFSARAEANMRVRVQRLPKVVRGQARRFAEEWEDVGGPLALSAKMILGAGVLPLAIFAAAYGLLFAAGRWLSVLLYSSFGAHDRLFWFTADPVLSLIVSSIIEPVRIALLAVAFDWCLHRWQIRRDGRATAQQETTSVAQTSGQPALSRSE